MTPLKPVWLVYEKHNVKVIRQEEAPDPDRYPNASFAEGPFQSAGAALVRIREMNRHHSLLTNH